jgi:hypothetical protein
MAQEQRHLVIDCDPMSPRPNTHLKGLFEGTHLSEESLELINQSFGEWTWAVKPEAAAEYERRRNVIAERLKQLYARGLIRYGRW